MIKKEYFAPCVDVVYVEVESGFTLSGVDSSGLPGEEPNFNDFGEF